MRSIRRALPVLAACVTLLGASFPCAGHAVAKTAGCACAEATPPASCAAKVAAPSCCLPGSHTQDSARAVVSLPDAPLDHAAPLVSTVLTATPPIAPLAFFEPRGLSPGDALLFVRHVA